MYYKYNLSEDPVGPYTTALVIYLFIPCFSYILYGRFP